MPGVVKAGLSRNSGSCSCCLGTQFASVLQKHGLIVGVGNLWTLFARHSEQLPD